jgi:putative membrane-bound dehydrogenase-like protein
MRQSIAPLFALLVLARALFAAPPDSIDRDYSEELPRIKPTEPADALKSFHVAKGFAIEQVAAEPLVVDPVAAAFDEDGRLYVVEMRDYSEQDKEQLGRVRLLEDTNGDGKFDKSTIFALGLSWPTAIICYGGGVFVGAPPDIYYLKDTNGDGKADERRVVFTGFERTNVQGMMNSFTWGLDNKIHVAVSSTGAKVTRPDDPKIPPLVLRGRDFAFDPRTLAMEATSGGGQHGMSFDDWGRKFVCSNSDHIQLVMLEDRYLARNPYFAAPSPRISIAADGPQADVFRTSPVEPWREVRTRLRKQGIVPGPVEGGGTPAGYFTGATGVTIYRGNAWAREFRGLAIVGDVGSNLIHRKRLSPRGLELIAARMDEKSEFITSDDIWFRPVQFLNAPDGGLYVLDMYREVIEHPASLPPIIKKHLDLTSGRDRGRIYRIVRTGFSQPKMPKLGMATTAELVALLEHENGWHRDTAARLLYERQNKAAIPLLETLAAKSKSPLGRMHALYALSGSTDQLHGAVAAALADTDPRVRAHAVRLSEQAWNGWPPLREALLALADDADPHVRFQLALSIGAIEGRQRYAVLKKIVLKDGDDRWVQAAVQSSLADGAGELFVELFRDKNVRIRAGLKPLLSSLAAQVGRQALPADIGALRKLVDELNAADKPAVAELLGLIAQKGSSPIVRLLVDTEGGKAAFDELIRGARSIAGDQSKSTADRAAAIAWLAHNGNADEAKALLPWLDPAQPVELQVAVAPLFADVVGADTQKVLFERWPKLSPRVRGAVLDAMLSSEAGAASLVRSLGNRKIPPADLDPARLQVLATHSDPQVRRVATLLSTGSIGRRVTVVREYQDSLKLPGNRDRGAELFKKNCANCHQVGGAGFAIGPSLAAMKARGAEAILSNVLDPNREVNPQYLSYTVVTKEGKTLSGMIVAETATSLTLRRAENKEDVVLRVDIEELRSTGLSLMPEGMEKQLDKQQMADVLDFLMKSDI